MRSCYEGNLLNGKIMFVLCCGHALNLVVKDACFKVKCFRKKLKAVREISSLLKQSPIVSQIWKKSVTNLGMILKVFIHFTQNVGQFVERHQNTELLAVQKYGNGLFYIYIFYIYIYMTINFHFTSRKNMDKKNTGKQNYTIARYQYTGKYLGV